MNPSRLIKQVSLSAALLCIAPLASAGIAEVTYSNVEKYRDIDASIGSQERFQERTLDTLSSYFQQLATELPADYVWRVNVTDVDLAGKIVPRATISNDRIRTVDRVDFPSIKFTYELVDGEGTVIKSGDEALKDLDFQDSMAARRVSREPLIYERKMIEQWFKNRSGLLAANEN